jgi:hypothetical protein
VVVDANEGLTKRSDARKREVATLVALGVAAVLVVVGVVVFLQVRADPGPAPIAAPIEEQIAPGVTAKPGGTLEPGAKAVAVEFIRATLSRTDLAKAWDLATPEFRSGVTKAEWLKGDLPITPFPVRDLETSGFNVVASAPGKVLLQVLLVPTANSDYIATRFDLTLVRKGADGPWKVSYFLPYAPPGIYAEPN